MSTHALEESAEAHPLNDLFNDVRAFHVAFGCAAPVAPLQMSPDAVEARAAWMSEEVQEFRDAKTLADQADACIDLLYFAVGGLVELGVIPGRLWEIVHSANMAKLWPDGVAHHRADGKIIKPPNWRPPEPKLEAEVHRQARECLDVLEFADDLRKILELP
jgi:predicted HAD superfamily Cof-like phosphohydrolase